MDLFFALRDDNVELQFNLKKKQVYERKKNNNTKLLSLFESISDYVAKVKLEQFKSRIKCC
jgi:hypothetical protein